jgi:NAD(P)-dependent dehydrogenase (short-subunit alcohol dehydrogenase family)
MPGELSRRTALVTGAAGGIGRELTRALLQSGASVMAGDVNERGLATLREQMSAAGLASKLAARPLDIADHSACSAAVEATQAHFGSIDILINNGAIGMGSIRDDHMVNPIAIEEVTPAIWDRFVAINLSGAWYMTRAAVPIMKRAGWGRIIDVTTSFFTMLRGRFHPYGPVKAGLEAMAAGHAKEFAGSGITVNVVVPGGPADTPMVSSRSGFKRSDLIPAVKMTHPVVWLCSRAADGVTGNRYIASKWDEQAPTAQARAAAEAPIGWPELATSPVWPGGPPKA